MFIEFTHNHIPVLSLTGSATDNFLVPRYMIDESLICSMEALRTRPDDFPWTIKQHAYMGRACFATRDIAPGQTIVLLPPPQNTDSDDRRTIYPSFHGTKVSS